MADFLTHVFLPLTAAYVLKREVFRSPVYLLLGGFGVLSDFDKFLGIPGLLHSLVTLIPIGLVILAVERWWRGEYLYGPVIVGLIFSHLVLDFVDGGPVPLLYPVFEVGPGLVYPAKTVFGQGLLGVSIEGPLVAMRQVSPRPGFNTYGFIRGLGVANLLLFTTIYVGDTWARQINR